MLYYNEKILKGTTMNLPYEFITKMEKLLGKDAKDFFESLDEPSQKAITVNFSRLEKSKFEKNCDFEISPISLVDNGYYAIIPKFSQNIFNHLGVVYSQEPSAMYPVEILGVSPNDWVLDVCASPGGKSIQILEKLKNTGLLVSNEIVFGRAKILEENLTRMGFENSIITCNTPYELGQSGLLFDKIIVDAPCGGEGMIRKNNFDINFYNPSSIDSNAQRQLDILENVEGILKDGGTLVYSTCTYDPRENEEVISKFLDAHPNYQVLNCSKYLKIADAGLRVSGHPLELSLRRYPHRFRGEGQFMVALTKTKTTNTESKSTKQTTCKNYTKVTQKEHDIINSTLKNVLPKQNWEYLKKGDEVYIIPSQKVNLSSLNVISIGVHLGTIQKNILKLAHEFYHTFGCMFFNQLELDKISTLKYLHGDELDIDMPNGIFAVNYLGAPLGGGKVAQGKLKNYYKKELRI